MPGTFRNVMVANRGEIAVRVFRACTELGIETTAVYSWEDRLSIHRYKADRAYRIGEKGQPVEAYLDGKAIVALAVEKGVDAIHPGYGFLSENAGFARQCRDAGIAWIGPSPEVMEALGDKISARKVARQAGVPVVPGSGEAISDPEGLREVVDETGFPLLIKAAHGGGGRGMRVVHTAEELPEAIRAARRESAAAFGSPEVFVERYVRNPRHIEVQLLGDRHGNRVHLFERDCSIQRRLQKIVELAPAPNLAPEVREQLCEYAVRLADAVGYDSAGTVEFLVEEVEGQEPRIYFIEVNTRIQVEHTVTEMVTGRDLIQAMIRVAEGRTLSCPEIGISRQEDIVLTGQAVQARVTTEDPENHFAPDSGRIITYRTGAGFGVRLDSAVGGSGAVILPHYDSLLVKVSAQGRNLPDAVRRLDRSLAEFRVRGVKTNVPFLQNVIRHPHFLNGTTHTRFIDETPELFTYPARRDRGTKALRALGDITVNGPPGSDERPVRPSPLLVPEPPAIPRTRNEGGITGNGPPPESPAFRVFREGGAEGLSAWMREEERLLVTDTTFRDAHQSLLATRVRTRDLADVAPVTAHTLPGLFSCEMWGGATFDVCMRFLQEDPWDRLALLRERMPGTLLQMLLRGANAVGYTNYPDNVVRAFIREAAAEGIDIFRIFDALNYLPNMELAMEEVASSGKIVEAAICYTGDVLDPAEDKYTLAYYVDLARELEARGAHILAVKDMAGLLKPRSARALIRALKDAVSLPIHLHTHDTAGNGVAMYLAAAEEGVDAVDCALSSMSGLTSQPSLNAVVTALRGDPRAPELDPDVLEPLSDHWELLRALYHPFESGLKAGTTDVYNHEIPGGQYSNLRPRAIQLGLGERWPEVKRTYARVDRELGRLIKVTPTSKVVADMAMFLVQNDLTFEEVYAMHDRGEEVDFPRSVRDFFAGLLGQPHGGFPERLQRIVLKGREPLTDRAGGHLPDYDWDEADRTLQDLLGRAPTSRERVSHALYPDVFAGLARTIQEFGEYASMDTVVFLYGMDPGEETFMDIEEGKTLVIKLLAIGEVERDGTRRVYFELNGQPRSIAVPDRSAELEIAARPQADRARPGEVGAPMPGAVVSIQVAPGDRVSRGDTLLTTEAMKMETAVTAPVAGTVLSLEVKEGERVGAGELVVRIEEASMESEAPGAA
jgi:pyruvate carboxylase